MKRSLALILALIFISGTAAGAVATNLTKTIEVTYRNIRVKVDGRTVETPYEPFVVNGDGRTYVPARPLAEALGAKVDWDEATATVLVYSSSYSVETESGDSKTLWYPAKGFGLTYPKTYVKIQPGLAGAALTLQRNTTTFSVTPSPAPSTDLDTWAAFSVMMMESLFNGFKAVAQEKILAGGVEVVDVTGEYSLGGSTLILKNRFFIKDGRGWVLTVSVDKTAYESLKPELDGIINSFNTIR